MVSASQGGGNPLEISPTNFGLGIYLCGLCRCLLTDPMMSLCGHRFCRACILRHLGMSDRYYCQRCLNEDDQVVEIKIHQVYPDNAIRREISRLPAQCHACDWTGTYGQWDLHLREICPMNQQLPQPDGLDQDQTRAEMLGLVAALEGRIRHLEESIRLQAIALTNINGARAQGSPSYNGTLLWKITGYAQKKQQAIQGTCLSLQSQEFYTSQYGYRLAARVYLNGDGMGRGTHLSLFLVVMKGDYDNLLTWPFQQLVLFQLVNRGQENHTRTIRPNPNSIVSLMPTTEQNAGFGFPEFATQQLVEERYIRDDTLFINIQIDTRGLPNLVALRFT